MGHLSLSQEDSVLLAQKLQACAACSPLGSDDSKTSRLEYDDTLYRINEQRALWARRVALEGELQIELALLPLINASLAECSALEVGEVEQRGEPNTSEDASVSDVRNHFSSFSLWY
jgi:hypothetical protein